MQPASLIETSPRSAARRAKHGVDRVTRGIDLLPQADGRKWAAKRYKAIVRAILIDCGGDECAHSKLQLIRRFAAASVLSEQLESRLAKGEQIDIAEHSQLSSTLVRLANKIGLQRIARNVGPTLGDLILADHEQQLAQQRAAAEQSERADVD